MFIDARELPDGSLLHAEIAIVGAGPAGLILARSLAATGRDVLLIESGGRDADGEAQRLAAGERSGDWYQPLVETRARQFGGTSHFWNSGAGHGQLGFRVGPLSAIDFERREWLPHSVGWPFGRDELDPFYKAAHAHVGLGAYEYAGAAWLCDGDATLPLDSDTFESTVWQFGTTETFTSTLQDEVADSTQIRCCLWTTVVELETDAEAAHVTRLRARTSTGHSLAISADTVVLAAGGIEIPRLLLMSNRVQREGLGNGNDLVGRFFMDHQYIRAGWLHPSDPGLFARSALYDTREVNGTLKVGKIDLTTRAMRDGRLLNMCAALVPIHYMNRWARREGVDALATLVRTIMRGRIPHRPFALLGTAIRHVDYIGASLLRKVSGGRLFRYFVPSPDLIAGNSWSELPDQDKRWSWFSVILHTEQAPHPDNRVTLSKHRDAFGSPLPHLHWEWREHDVNSVCAVEKLLADEIQRAGLGTLKLDQPDDRPHLHHPGLHHHMGTTRMHRDPAHGVVDEHCRVHGVDNLYVASCSVFPSGGYINPTLTLLALSLRLGQHLSETLDLSPSASTAPDATGRAS